MFQTFLYIYQKQKMGYTITLILGLILFFISIYLFNKSLEFIRSGNRTEATVIQLEKVSDSEGVTYKPIFSFKTFTNQEVIYRYYFSSSPASWKIGEKVTIVYDSNNVENAKILTYFGAFGWAVILMAMAMPLMVVGGGYFWVQKFLY